MLRLHTTLSMAAGCFAGCMRTGTTLHLTELNWKEEVEYSGKLLHVVEFSSPWCRCSRPHAHRCSPSDTAASTSHLFRRWSGTHSCDDMAEAWEILGEEYNNSALVQIGEDGLFTS